MEEKCNLGHKGYCCCGCANQVQINCHPSNGNNKAYGFLEDRIKIGKGSINERLGWGCEMFRKMEDTKERNLIIFMDNQHGCCEMYQKK